MRHISVTPIENLMFPERVAARTALEKPPVLVKAATTTLAPNCVDVAGHSVTCSVCKRVDLLERSLLVVVSALVSALMTALVVWRLLRQR